MLSVIDIQTAYGAATVLKKVSLTVKAGSIATLIGANGAGKTTTLMAISGIIASQSGEILLDGEQLIGMPPHRVVAAGVCHVPEGRRIFPKLTVLENLEMGAYLHPRRGKPDEVFSLFPRLAQRRFQQAGTLSGGEQQMLAIGRALMSSPKLLLLDEPSLGLAPLMVEQIFRIIGEINRQGVTILLVEQNAYAALALAHWGYVMENGRIVLSDTPANLMNNTDVQSAYLGHEA